MHHYRLWRFKRRYSRMRRRLAQADQWNWPPDLEAAVDKFARSLSEVSLEDWQRWGLRERRWR